MHMCKHTHINNVLHLWEKQTPGISFAGKMHMFSFCVFFPMFLTITIFHYILVRSLGVERGEIEKEGKKWKYTLSVLIRIYLIQLQNSI